MTEIAKNFGDALYDLSLEENLTETVLPQLRALDEAFCGSPDFITLLAAPSLPKEKRCAILDESFRDQVHIYVLNFLKILVERGYIRQFSGCCQEYYNRFNEDNGILPVTAVTAAPIPASLKEKLEKKLQAVTGKTVQITYHLDPDCIGGIRLDMDGKRLDDTVQSHLEQIRASLKSTVL